MINISAARAAGIVYHFIALSDARVIVTSPVLWQLEVGTLGSSPHKSRNDVRSRVAGLSFVFEFLGSDFLFNPGLVGDSVSTPRWPSKGMEYDLCRSYTPINSSLMFILLTQTSATS